MKPTILFVDVDQTLFLRYAGYLREYFEMVYLDSSNANISRRLSEPPEVIIYEINGGTKNRYPDFLKKIQNEDKFLPVLVLTDESTISFAAEALKFGAFNFLPKKSAPAELKLQIDSLLNFRYLLSRAHYLELEDKKQFDKIVGYGREIENVKETACAYALNDDPVLIHGERGTGKETVARQIHRHSDRGDKPFISVNCNAIPGRLMETEIFGYERIGNDLTMCKKPGKLELANGGTIFFDEISELDPKSQLRLLKFINEGIFERVGGKTSISLDVRLISSTTRGLDEIIKSGVFREDLYYFIDVLPIYIPPIRERLEDIPYLIEDFARKVSLEFRVPYAGFSEEATKIFLEYDWPGNIRELQSYVTSAVMNAKGRIIEPEDLKTTLLLNDNIEIKPPERIPKSWEEMEEMKKEASYQASRRIEKIFLENLISNHRLPIKPYINKSKAS